MSVLSSISALKNKVNLYIKQNFQQLITGPVLNTILHDTIDTIQSLISPLEANKLNKTAVGYDPIGGLNIPSGTYRVNGVDILTLIVSGGGGPAGDHNASAGALPTVGTGIAGAIKKGDYWRVSVAGTITGMTPNAVLQLGDVIFARIADAAVAADFFAISGNADISAILFAITTINAKLSTIETSATADQTASEIRDLLITLLTTDRLPQSAVRDIVNAEYINASFTSLDTIKKALDACVTKLDTAVLTAQINALKDSVPAGGDTLRKLYEAIQTINTLLTSNDVNLDTIQEIITFIKNNKDVIDSISTSKVNITDIVDTLLSVAPNRPLSANQGLILKGLIDALTLTISTLAPLRPVATKTALVDADETTGNDSAATFGQIKTTWLNVKAFLKTYFDTIYQNVLVSGTNLKTVGGTSLLGAGNIPISASITIDPVPTPGSTNPPSSGGTFDAAYKYAFNDQTTSYTIALSDVGKKIRMNNSSPNTVTIPPNSAVAFGLGSIIAVRVISIGVTTIAAGVGVTINSPNGSLSLSAQYNEALLVKEGTDLWSVVLVGASLLPTVASGEKVVTATPAGLQIYYDVQTQLVSVGTLASADWSSGQATYAGLWGNKTLDTNYVYECIATNTWIRTSTRESRVDLYLADYNDSVADATSAQLDTAYPTAVIGQKVWGTVRCVYEKKMTNIWKKIPITTA